MEADTLSNGCQEVSVDTTWTTVMLSGAHIRVIETVLLQLRAQPLGSDPRALTEPRREWMVLCDANDLRRHRLAIARSSCA